MPPAAAPRVAILSSTFGGGHQKVAEVLARGFRERHPDAHIEIRDFYADFINATLNGVLTRTYVTLARHAPQVWRAFYRGTNEVTADSALQRLINGFGMRRWLEYRAEHAPDVAICTHPTPAGTVSQANQAGARTPCVTVMTDYIAHSQWVHPAVDRYLAPSPEVADDLARRGVRRDRIVVTGVPVDPAIAEPVDRDAVFYRYGFEGGLPLVLLMVGAQALVARLPRIVRRLLAAAPMNLLVICGRSRSVLRSMRDVNHPNLRAAGFVPDVPVLMGAADLLITKPGGVTVSEALARGVPMILFKPIPGQEEGNVAYVLSHAAAALARRPRELAALVAELLADPPRRLAMAERARQIGRPHSTRDALDVVDALLRERVA